MRVHYSMTTPQNSDPNQPTPLPDVHGRPATNSERAYRDGYVEGRVSEQGTQGQREQVAESNGVANGIILGGLLAAIVGLGTAAFVYFNRPPVAATRSVNQPAAPVATPKPSSSVPTNQTTVIERTIEKAAPPAEVKVIEVPQAAPVPAPAAPPQSAPASQASPAPASPSSSPADSTTNSPTGN